MRGTTPSQAITRVHGFEIIPVRRSPDVIFGNMLRVERVGAAPLYPRAAIARHGLGSRAGFEGTPGTGVKRSTDVGISCKDVEVIVPF